MDEQELMTRAQRSADFFTNRYPDQMEALCEHSALSRIRKINAFDLWALGEQLVQFETYLQFMNEEGTAKDLGTLPNIALDIITAAYGTSIIPLLASVQPIDEETGTVYFKRVKATNTRGNVTAGQVLRNGIAVPEAYAQGYAGEKVTAALGNTADGTQAYNGILAKYPVRPLTIRISVATLGLSASDDGNGVILGSGLYGTINYATGAWTLNFTANPAGVYAVSCDYGTDFEAGGSIPQVSFETASTSINAEIFLLGSEVGIFKAYSMKKRFGMVAEDEMAQDLTNEMTSEIGNTLIARLISAAGANVDWSKTPGDGISWNEHKLELLDKFAEVEAAILNAAGRGVITTMIAGPSAAGTLSALPGFVKSEITMSGPQIYGTLNGITVIRAPQVTTNKIYCIYKGTGYFDAPIVYSPYMPLYVTHQQHATNPVKKQSIAAVWAGAKVVVPGYIASLTITTG